MRIRTNSQVAAAVMLGFLGIGVGCQEAGSEMTLTGRIVYVVSSDVQEYDLVSGERREVYRHASSLDSPITAVDESSFIVGGVVTGGKLGMLLVGADGRAHELGKGHNQAFFPAHGKLLYLSVPPGQSHPHLHEATLRENRLESPRVVDKDPFFGAPILAISDDELLVRRRHGPYTKYDLGTGLFVDLPIENCWPAAWRSQTQEVICVDETRKGGGYALVGLDGRRRPVPGLKGLAVAVYVPSGDYVLAGKPRWSWSGSRSGEVMDLYSYDFSTNARRRIAKDVTVGLTRNTYWSPMRREEE